MLAGVTGVPETPARAGRCGTVPVSCSQRQQCAQEGGAARDTKPISRAQRAHGSQAHPSAVTRCLSQCINHELCIQLVLQGVKIFLHLEISKKLISKTVAFSLMPPEGLEGATCMEFFADCCQAYAECQAPVALPVHKRMLQIPEMTVFLAGARHLQPRQ